jgi:hypothetical protein
MEIKKEDGIYIYIMASDDGQQIQDLTVSFIH